MSWTDERIDVLKRMWEEGHPASRIAEELGGVSRNAVIGKAHRLGLEKRPSPVKADKRKAAPAAPVKAAKPKKKKKKSEAKPAAETVVPEPAPAPADTPDEAEPPVEETVVAIEPKVPLSKRSDVDQSSTPAPRIQIHDPRPAPRPAPKKPLRPAPRSAKIKDKTSLLDLNERICKWPIGHPGEPEFHFCGKPAEPGFPYCNGHCAEAYQAQQPRKDRPGRTPMPNLPRPR
ncbi:MAG: GcrA family cell cycle regulator [Pacificimonas sp.]|jgi:GcrA cell cycle regulator|nr:GcrA family cell cycle regulator [Pacificimonas sp.]